MDLMAAVDASSTLERPRIDFEAAELRGSRCRHCGAAAWPGRAVCPHCGAAEMDEVSFAGHGILKTFTTVWVPRPNLPAPYVLGQVDLSDGVRVFAHGRGRFDDLRVPCPVRLVVSTDADSEPPFWFEPESDEQPDEGSGPQVRERERER